MARVAIVEDHLLLAEMLCAALTESGIEAQVVDARRGDDLLGRLTTSTHPDLVLLDLDLGELGDSTWLIGPLTSTGVRVLVVTGTTDRWRVAAALEAGAVGYQLKASGFDALLERAKLALATTDPLDPEDRAALLAELSRARAVRQGERAPFEQLTGREAETLRELARGHCVSDIAARWVVSEATMRTHVRNVLTKLGASSQLEAVAEAVRTGWFMA